jgi:hypothetical protein
MVKEWAKCRWKEGVLEVVPTNFIVSSRAWVCLPKVHVGNLTPKFMLLSSSGRWFGRGLY